MAEPACIRIVIREHKIWIGATSHIPICNGVGRWLRAAKTCMRLMTVNALTTLVFTTLWRVVIVVKKGGVYRPVNPWTITCIIGKGAIGGTTTMLCEGKCTASGVYIIIRRYSY